MEKEDGRLCTCQRAGSRRPAPEAQSPRKPMRFTDIPTSSVSLQQQQRQQQQRPYNVRASPGSQIMREGRVVVWGEVGKQVGR